MSIANIVASGLNAYLGTNRALQQMQAEKDQMQAEKEREQEQQARFNSWQADQQARDNLYQQMEGSGGSQPAQRTNVNAPPTAVVPEASFRNETQTALQKQPIAPATSPRNLVSQGINPTPATGTAPPATATSQPQAFNLQALKIANNQLDQYQAEAARLNDQNALNLIKQRRQALLGRWAGAYKGDPNTMPGALGYAQHIAQGAAVLGNPLTPGQAIQIAAAKSAYDSEGSLKGLQLANSGDAAGALKYYNSTGNHQFKDLILTPAVSAAGVKSYNMVGVNADGSKVNLGNAFDGMMGMMTTEQRLKAYQDRLNTQERLRHDKAVEAIQAANANRLSKSQSPAQIQTANWLIDNGVAKDATEAWRMLSTAKQQSRSEAIQSIAGRIMAGQAVNDPNKAVQQAAQIVDAVQQAAGQQTTEPETQPAATQPTAPAYDRADVVKRFRADPKMNGFTLGRDAPEGVEVIKNGMIVGHYR